MLLTLPCARIMTVQVPGGKVPGSFIITCVKSKPGTERTPLLKFNVPLAAVFTEVGMKFPD